MFLPGSRPPWSSWRPSCIPSPWLVTPQNCSPCTGSPSGCRGTSPPLNRSGSLTTSPAGVQTHGRVSVRCWRKKREEKYYNSNSVDHAKIKSSYIPNSWCRLMSHSWPKRTICINYNKTAPLTDVLYFPQRGTALDTTVNYHSQLGYEVFLEVLHAWWKWRLLILLKG